MLWQGIIFVQVLLHENIFFVVSAFTLVFLTEAMKIESVPSFHLFL